MDRARNRTNNRSLEPTTEKSACNWFAHGFRDIATLVFDVPGFK
jgi:hypothetical protein